MSKQYEEYKDSGVEVLGQIPAQWELRRGRDVINILNGYPFDSALFENDPELGFPLIRIRNIMKGGTDTFYSGEVLENYVVDNGDILVGMDGDFNCCEWNGGRALLNQRVCKVNGEGRLNNRYLYYILPLYLKVINDLTYYTTVKHLSNKDINNIILPYPPESEVQSIADYLDYKTGQIDKLIAQKEELVNLLQKKRQAIINEAVTQGLNPNAPRRDSGIEWLGEIPAHWEVSKLKYLTSKIGSGVTPLGGSETYLDEGIPLLRSQNVYPDGLRLDDVAFISEEVHNSMSNSQVEVGDVLLNITGASIGRCFYYEGQFGEANVNQHVCIIRPNENLTTKFLQLVLSSDIGQHQIMLSQNGASREGLTFAQLRNFVIPLPSEDEQEFILRTLSVELDKIKEARFALETQIKKLKSYRQSIISEVVTGKVDVREVVLNEA